MNFSKAPLLLSFCLLISLSTSFAQSPFPSLSPKGSITQVVGNTTIKVEYERPSVRNREVFGGLVPWNMVWRAGAGYCTKISFDRAVNVGGQPVEAGVYSLFTIPNQSEWTVILNADTSLYGSGKYDQTKDVARIKTNVRTSERHYETVTIDIDVIPNNAQLFISWANTQVSFEVQTSTDEDALEYIAEQLMTDKIKDPNEYASAAEHLQFHDINLSDAIILADKSIAIKWSGWASRLKMELYEKLENYDKAIAAAAEAISYEKQQPKRQYYDPEEEIKRWEAQIERLMSKQ